MNKSAGKYVVDGTKKGFSFFFHHFSRFFVFWVFELAGLLASVTVFLKPVFQKFYIQVSKMIDDSGDAIYSKGFDQADNKKGYVSLLLFDVIWFFVVAAGIALIMGIVVLIQNVCLQLNVSWSPSGEAYFSDILSFTYYLYIPFGIAALIFFIFGLLVFQTAKFVSYKNPELSLSDVIFNTFRMVRTRGKKLFAVNLLFFLEILTYAAFIVVPLLLINILVDRNSDPTLINFITWILIPAFTFVSIFLIPLLLTSYRLGIFELMMDVCPCETTILVYKQVENNNAEPDFVPLTPVKDEDGNINYVQLNSKKNDKRKEK